MTLTTKVGGGALIASSLAGLGVAGGRQLRQEDPSTTQQKTKISTLIADRYDYILLNATSSNEDIKDWETNWNTYQRDNAGQGKDIFDLDGWTPTETKDLKDKLKKKCSLLANTSISKNDNKTYENVTKYCARSVTIADQAKKEKLRILSVENNSGDDFTIFGRRADANGALNEELKALKVNGNHFRAAYKIRDACKTIVATNKKNDEYEDIFKAYKKVCARQPRE
ncbi:hypothetical protein A6V39_01305 [Candidatus Mycoplasma haematobovis]|uniref:Uncharacterized protein n=1 Tax=Candidatus Mycoplasma haematobovis TaxID=432608 RepID=A0A1A9QFA1_9MOLU|nr:hypothetical protein [Candidatus Mycoplasma haematobovis]OAL10691.1 hypothetical protein A6V39_01305 [Candidatus Mycoplasma haematobovis]